MSIFKKLLALAEFALRKLSAPKTPAKSAEQVKEQKDKFRGSDHAEDLFRRSWGVAVKQGTRAPVYGTKDENKRIQVRECAQCKVEEIAKQYKRRKVSEVSEKRHIENIKALQDALTNQCGKYLHNRKFRFGRAQKLLNTYLKCLWCANWLKVAPPHCPFDRAIICDLSLPNHDNFWDKLAQCDAPGVQDYNAVTWNWTQSDCIGDYLVWVAAAKEVVRRSGYRSLAEWELFEWKRPQKGKK